MDPSLKLPGDAYASRRGARLGLASAVLAALVVLSGAWVFFRILVWDPEPGLLSLVEVWLVDDEASYGFLIPPLAAYFVWERHHQLRGLPAEGSVWGLALVGVAFGFYFVGMLGGINYLPRASAVILLLGGVLWIGGPRWTKELAFPVLFLLLMVPLPKFALIRIAFPLQVFAAEMAELALYGIGVPILRTGNVIQLPYTQLEVAEACSGLRSLLALITTGVVFAHFFGHTRLQRLIVVAASIPIAILVNAFRVAGTGWLAHTFGTDVATGFYHTLEGFAMFGIAFALLAGIGFGTGWLFSGPTDESAT
jgi:exosortase